MAKRVVVTVGPAQRGDGGNVVGGSGGSDTPLGGPVEQGTGNEPEEPSQPAERLEPGWRESSFDLAYGLEVQDATDTVPGELLDELFRKPAQ
jgi:hypothetical protein